jgi:hypothetical protein
MAADEEDCVSYACECVRLAGLTDDEIIREQLLKLARHWLAVREIDYSPRDPFPLTHRRA